MKKSPSTLAAAVALACSSTVLAGLVELPAGAVTNSSAISTSALAPGGSYEWLAKIEDSSGDTACSGALVASEWVLSAAHCVAPSSTQIQIGLDDPIAIDQTGSVSYPGFSVTDLLAGRDLALFHLAQPSNRTPVRFGSLVNDVAVGDTVTAAGWGYAADPSTSTLPSSPHAGVTSVAGVVYDNRIITTFSGSKACDGDSGGPLLKQGRLVGITSFGDSHCAYFAGYTRLAPLRSWIFEVSGAGNDPPVASSGSATVAAGHARFVDRTATDPDGGPLTYSILSRPRHGKLSLCSADGPTCRYTPAAGFTGSDAFVWAVSDGIHAAVSATTVLDVRENAAPIGSSAEATGAGGAPIQIPIAATDPDGDPLSFTIVSTPTTGSISGSCDAAACSMSFMPNDGVIGTTTIAWTVSDGFSASGPYDATIHVTPAPSRLMIGSFRSSVVDAAWLAQSIAGSDPVSNATFTGDPEAVGQFTGGSPATGLDHGIVLGSGAVELAQPTYPFPSTAFGRSGTSLLDAPGMGTADAAILEYDTVPSASHLDFRYVFASMEYISGSAVVGLDDAAAIIVDGRPCTIPGDVIPSPSVLNQGLVDLDGNPMGGATNPSLMTPLPETGPGPMDMRGVSTALECSVAVEQGAPVHVAIAIADRGTTYLGQVDSVLFVQAAGAAVSDSSPLDVSIPPLEVNGSRDATKFKVVVRNQSSSPQAFDDSMVLATDSSAGSATGIPISVVTPVSKVLRPGKSAMVTLRWQHGDGIHLGEDRELRACVVAGGRHICAARPVVTRFASTAVTARMAPVRRHATNAKVAVTITNVGSVPATIRPADISMKLEINGSPVEATFENSPASPRRLLKPGQAAQFSFVLSLPALAVGDVVSAVVTTDQTGDPDPADDVAVASRTTVR